MGEQCECPIAGYCERRKTKIPNLHWQMCQRGQVAQVAANHDAAQIALTRSGGWMAVWQAAASALDPQAAIVSRASHRPRAWNPRANVTAGAVSQGAAAAGGSEPVDLAGFPVRDVLLRTQEIPCPSGVLDRAALRDLLLSRGAELIYLRGTAALTDPSHTADTAPALSATWLIRMLLDALSAAAGVDVVRGPVHGLLPELIEVLVENFLDTW